MGQKLAPGVLVLWQPAMLGYGYTYPGPGIPAKVVRLGPKFVLIRFRVHQEGVTHLDRPEIFRWVSRNTLCDVLGEVTT